MSAAPVTLEWARDGAALHPGAALLCLDALLSLAETLPQARAGVRLHGNDIVARYLSAGAVHDVARTYLGDAATPVRAILFDKSPAANWSLGWHQDRTIAVRHRAAVAGFGPWSTKQGILHVEPPEQVTAAMVTLRIHLDDVPIDNAPLMIAPGSHRLGRVSEAMVDDTVARCGISYCLARAGDVWAYATPILHTSAAMRGVRRRRVLQADYAASALPAPLEWLGI